VLGNSDDNVFIDNVDGFSFPSDKFTAVSLRLSESFNFCQPANTEMKTPKFIPQANGMLTWDWRDCCPLGGWGYPHPVDSNIYDRQYLINLLKNGNFTNPSSMEVWMDERRDPNKPYMACFKKAKIINVANNRVTTGSNNTCGNASPDELNRLYLNNKRIKVDQFDYRITNACHIIEEYQYED